MGKFKTQPNQLPGNESSKNDELNKLWLSQYLKALKLENIEPQVEFEPLYAPGNNEVSICINGLDWGRIEIIGKKKLDYEEMREWGREPRILIWDLADLKIFLNETKDVNKLKEGETIDLPDSMGSTIVCEEDYFIFYYDDGCVGIPYSDLESIHFVWDQIIDFEL